LNSPLVRLAGRLTFHKGPPHRLKALTDLPFYDYLCEHSEVVALLRKIAYEIASGGLFYRSRPRSPDPIGIWGNDYSHPGNLDRASPLGEALFDEIKRICDANHVRLIVLTTGFMKFITPNNPTGAFYRDLPSFLAARRIPFIDISNEFAAATRGHLVDYMIPWVRHPNERGSALIAALIWPHLRGQLQKSVAISN
jgi:hypothetical protein